MYDVSVTCNPYVGITGYMGNDRFFPKMSEEDYNKCGQDNMNQVMEGVRKRKGLTDTIIDMGCGNLRIGRFLSKECKKYIGVDISQTVLDSARQKVIEYNLKNVNLVLANEFNEKDSCDLLICFQVFQHNTYKEQIRLIRKIENVLKPGGWACIHLPKHENKPDYINYDTCMCFTKSQTLELGSYFSTCELEENTLLVGWDDYYIWVQKKV
jgi:SAM-dependent methyltransferase